ncbi:15953_t:CDS:1 [Funneliformis caledonium]|uniref:15953_t:CDS:1 n=1 Tax=Funneliformis caledonium TaxID=1117310 RepID=A0A9N9CEF3_9GLOM|nr:15953_t:CDS:1 [Funneliformis caledonium]
MKKSITNLLIIHHEKKVIGINERAEDVYNHLATFNETYDLKSISFAFYTYSGFILAMLCAPSSLLLKCYLILVLFSRTIADKKSEEVVKKSSKMSNQIQTV